MQPELRLHDAALSRLEAQREIHESLRHPRVRQDRVDHSGGGAARILRALPHQRLERLPRLAAREERRGKLLRVLLGPVLRARVEVEPHPAVAALERRPGEEDVLHLGAIGLLRAIEDVTRLGGVACGATSEDQRGGEGSHFLALPRAGGVLPEPCAYSSAGPPRTTSGSTFVASMVARRMLSGGVRTSRTRPRASKSRMR